VQVRVLPIADRHHEYAGQVAARLREAGARVEVDERSATMRAKIRDGELEKIPYLLVVGDREQQRGAVAVRKRGEGDLGSQSVEEFLSSLAPELRGPRA
jgi:threonyl-tRNA synthetase